MQRQTRLRQTTDRFGPGHTSMSYRMNSDVPTTVAAYLRLLLSLLEEHGLDGRALLWEIDLSTLRLEEPEARITSQ